MEIDFGSAADQEIATSPVPQSDAELAVAAEKFITFEIGETAYAIVASAVLEVAHQLPVTTVPNSPAHLTGIAPLRDEVSAVVNLRGLLGEIASRDRNAKPRHIVLKKRGGDSVPVAFLVDRLGEISQIEITSIHSEPDGSDMMIGAATLDGGRKLKIIDHRKIASADFIC
jgi:chemotaxis signal transduction protein